VKLMNAISPLKDAILVTQLTTKTEIKAQLWDQYNWNSCDIVKEPGLVPAVLFLTRDVGIEDNLEPFRAYLAERALEVFNRLAHLGDKYTEAATCARKAYQSANDLNGAWVRLVGVISDLRRAVGLASCIAVEDVLGNSALDTSDVEAREDLVLAERLIDTLRSNDLL
jgi:hypothetical protein